jgi:hypothetical protein
MQSLGLQSPFTLPPGTKKAAGKKHVSLCLRLFE